MFETIVQKRKWEDLFKYFNLAAKKLRIKRGNGGHK
jgi:hypothetical protein